MMETNNLSIEKVFEELAKTNRRVEELQRTLETFDDDRQILESVQGRLTSLEEQVRLGRANDSSVSKDIKTEIQLVGDRVEAAVKTEVEKVTSMVQKKKITSKSKNILARIFRR